MKEFLQLTLICVAGSILIIGTYYYFLQKSICMSEYAAFLIAYILIMCIAANINITEEK